MITIFWPWLVVIGLCVFAAGFVIACLLAAAGMVSRDTARINSCRVPLEMLRPGEGDPRD